MNRILLIDRFPASLIEQLRALPAEVMYVPDIDPAGVEKLIADYDILILNSKVKVNGSLADLAPRLRLVIRAGVGMDHIDIPALEQRGITALNTPGANADAVGEQTLGMLLALRHQILTADHHVRQFEWLREVHRGTEIKGKTVGIIGYGNTGKAVARKLSGFECRVLAYDKFLTNYGDAYANETPLQTLLQESEIISLHVPLTPATRGWINDRFFSQLGRPIILLNLARGPIVSLQALIHALDKGQVLGAALDVLENEKLPTLTPAERKRYQNLFARKNVIFTPHIGGWTFESLENINRMILNYIHRFPIPQR